MAKGVLDEILDRVQAKAPQARKRLAEEVHRATAHMHWVPNPGPQTDAYLSEADILLYGGQAGGGKSQLELGWCINEASNGIIFRRELSQTDGLEKDGKLIIGTGASFNGTDLEWTWGSGKTLKLGGMKDADSWIAHAGRERGTICFDEAGEFLERQVASMWAWNRAPVGERTRMILASNPPRTAEGLWMFRWFGPWLDPSHPLYPTMPGDLRWAFYVGDEEGGDMIWVEGPGEYQHSNGESYIARSLTFIPAALKDNPYRDTPEYRAKLMSLPEPLRSQLLKGDFQAGMQDGANQAIPTEWVRAAMRRWEESPRPPEGIPMCAMGVDCVGGGKDKMVIAPRYDAWYAELIKVPAKEIPLARMGSHSAGLIVANRRNNALPIIDMGGGYGGPTYEKLNDIPIECHAYKGAAATTKRTRDGKFGFTNVRSAAYWGLREDLDPDQPNGSPVCLPPDPRLLAGLCAPTFEVTPQGIKLEPKSKREGGVKGVVERLGWSPDEADAVVMSRWMGPRGTTHSGDWAVARQTRGGRGMTGMAPKVVQSHQAARRKR